MESLSWEDRDGARWIELEGELDHPACLALREKFHRVVVDGDGDVVVVLDAVAFLSSMAIGLLLKARETLIAEDRRLKLTGLKPGVRKALQMMNLDRVFDEI